VCIATKRKKITKKQLYDPNMREVPSPCNSVCRIDAVTGFCLGCKRTLEEIADWPMLTDGEKRAVLRALAARNLSPQA